MINIHNHTDIHLFLNKVKYFLSKNPSENNLALGILYNRQHTTVKNGEYFIAASDQDHVVFTLIKTHTHFIIAGKSDHVEEVSNFLHTQNISIIGLLGEKNIAQSLAEAYCKNTSKDWIIKMDQFVYRITKLKEMQYVKGELQLATEDNISIISDWIFMFCKEVLDPISIEAARERAKEGIKENAIHIWKTDKIVAMVKSARPADKGIVVNYVYTPLENRGKGYASSMVHQLTKLLFKKYEFCSLFADADNPTSNYIYEKIGYEKVGQAVAIDIID